MDETIQSHLEGTKDMFPEDHRYLTFLKKVFRHEFRKNGFGRISTPLIESEALLRKAYPKNGNAYGLYNFEAKNGENIALLPTHTPGIIRSYLEYDMQEMPQPVYYYYMERSFRQSRTRKECYVF